ncbi:MAG: amidophosphoribosyltransferase [Eggerthellaceae bacterium]|nr:amidophosphoribosyltransferase [Eggerthellaceae bacterium]
MNTFGNTFESLDHVEDECAVFGVYAQGEDVARMACYGLQALQHRGQESAGIAVGDGETIMVEKDLGLVTQVFTESSLSALIGDVAVGHVRYSTSGGKSSWEAAQPHISAIDNVLIALAHNGTLMNTSALKAQLVAEGEQFRSNSDSEIAAKAIGLITRKTHHLRSGIQFAMENLYGAYAMVLASPDSLYAFRDPNGIRPLCIGVLPDGAGWVVSSESCGLDIVGATYLRDVEPGEIVRLNKEGMYAEQAVPPKRYAACVVEAGYFARPGRVVDGQSVYQARREMGRILAKEAPVKADLVLGVPDSGVPAALGYAFESHIAFTDGIVKNRYVGRTFIAPSQAMRQLGIRLKLNPLPDVLRGKRLIVVDDSIVRGNTSKRLVKMLREAGASEVHLRIVSPEVMWPCFYGIDTDTRDQLIAANMDLDEMNEWIGSDSLAFLSLDGLRQAVSGVLHEGFCDACFSGDYPVPIPDYIAKKSFMTKKDLEKRGGPSCIEEEFYGE